MGDDCIFCKIVKGEIPSEKVLENEDFIVIKNIDPLVDGHSLVIPKKHYGTFLDLPLGLYEKLLETAKKAIEKLDAKDFQLVTNSGEVAGQSIPHMHLHILPRKEGDGFEILV